MPAVAGSGMFGSLSAVPYWKDTFPITADGLKSAPMPESVNTTLFLMSAFVPVTGVFPVAVLSPADVIPYCSPSRPAGPCKLEPGKLPLPNKPRPDELIPRVAPLGAPESDAA